MTNEEAIGKLSNIKFYLTAGNPIWDTDTIREVMDMAIESLTERKGKWIPTGEWEEAWAEMHECSVCGATEIGTAKYCYNCGARMKGEKE